MPALPTSSGGRRPAAVAREASSDSSALRSTAWRNRSSCSSRSFIAASWVREAGATRSAPTCIVRRWVARRMSSIAKGAVVGAVTGLAGASAMAAASKLEQLATRRPDSYVPAHTLGRLLQLRDPDSDSWPRNMAMHYLAGATAGALRGVMSAANLRGPLASLMHANLRLSFDQTLENATGAGAPPWTWPRDELIIDLSHKTLYALVTGALSDRLITPVPTSSAQRRRLGARLKGFA